MFLQWVLENSLYSLWRHVVRHPKRAVVESSSNGISCPYLGLEYNDAFRIAALPWCHQIISSLFLRVGCAGHAVCTFHDSMKVVRKGYTQIRNKCIGISNLFKIRHRHPVVQGWYHHWGFWMGTWGQMCRCSSLVGPSKSNWRAKNGTVERQNSYCSTGGVTYIRRLYICLPLPSIWEIWTILTLVFQMGWKPTSFWFAVAQ